MKSPLRIALAAATCAASLLAVSCSSVNHLDGYSFSGARLGAEVVKVSEPRMEVSFPDTHPRYGDVLGTALHVLTGIALANQASRVDDTMRAALQEADMPGLVRAEALRACSRALGAEPQESTGSADYVLSLELDDWGISARSGSGGISLRMNVTATLYHSLGGVVWRRVVSIEEPARPDMFGIPGIIGDMVTTTELSEMTDMDIVRGFTELARHVARRTSRLLEDDLDDARDRW